MELIEREAALTVIEQAAAWGQGHNAIYDDMRDIPSVDAVPVVHGRWVFGGNNIIECSQCEMCYPSTRRYKQAFFPMNYCPNCGARMDGGEEHEAD